MSAPARVQHLFDVREYQRMVEAGVFEPGARVELVAGEILDISPQSSRHATAVRLVEEALREAFDITRRPFDVRVQLPMSLGADSEPEPDIAVVDGGPRDYANAHPRSARLIVEVSDTSIDFDRGRKRRLYAGHDISEYWILDLGARRLEIHRDPRGDRYAETLLLGPQDEARPEGGTSPVLVADLLP